MHPTQTTNRADQISLLTRWLGLIGLALMLGWGNSVNFSSLVLIIFAGFWNVVLTVLSLNKRRFPYHEFLVLGLDVVFAFLLLSQGTYQGEPFFWGGLIPILSGAIYFSLQGGLFTSLGIVLVDGIFLTVALRSFQVLSDFLMPAAIMLTVGLVVGFFAQQVSYYLRQREAQETSRQEDAERKERERIKALYKITSTMTATLDYQKVLDMSLDLTANVLSEKGDEVQIVSAALLFENDELHVRSARRFTPMDNKVVLAAQEGLLDESLRSGQPRKLKNPIEDPELNKIVALRSCDVVYCYPLRTLQEMFGVLLFGHPDPEFFNELRTEILDIIGRQAFVALQNATLYHDLEQEKERMMEIQEEARKQLARDLHDGPTQSVAAIAMRVNFARRMIERDVRAAAEELYKVEDLARRTTKEVRHMLFTLRPLVLETAGLSSAFESMAEKMSDTYNQNVVVEAEAQAMEDLEAGKQGVIFYIAEEAVNNARKHAEAEKIWVRLLKHKPDVILLEVEDNGVGFNVGEVDSGYERRGSLGMVNMRERTELINGVIRVNSEVGKGTRIQVWVPLTEEATDQIKRGRI
jgi:signal transduction histidine kinase